MADSPNVEPLLPKISLSWLIALVTLCSVSMAIVQQAVTEQQTWSVLASLVLAAVVLPLLFYVGTFALASLVSAFGSAATTGRWGAIGEDERQCQPTTRMPDEWTGGETTDAPRQP